MSSSPFYRGPIDIAVLPSGDLLVVDQDWYSSGLYRLSRDGSHSEVVWALAQTDTFIQCVAVTTGGRVFVKSQVFIPGSGYVPHIRIVDLNTGTNSIVYAGPILSSVLDMAALDENTLLLADENHGVVRLDVAAGHPSVVCAFPGGWPQSIAIVSTDPVKTIPKSWGALKTINR